LKETKSERLATFLPDILKEHNIKGSDGDVATLRRIIASPGWNDGGETTSNFESTIRRFVMRPDARTQGIFYFGELQEQPRSRDGSRN
jgi:hypothetical protein